MWRKKVQLVPAKSLDGTILVYLNYLYCGGRIFGTIFFFKLFFCNIWSSDENTVCGYCFYFDTINKVCGKSNKNRSTKLYHKQVNIFELDLCFLVVTFKRFICMTWERLPIFVLFSIFCINIYRKPMSFNAQWIYLLPSFMSSYFCFLWLHIKEHPV